MRADEPQAQSEPSVSLITNCYEATFRTVLHADYWTRVVDYLQRPVTKRVAVINNVLDRCGVERMADKLVCRGKIDEYYFVADHLDQALQAVQLPHTALGRIPHYSDCAFVALEVCSSEYLLYWDADVTMLTPHDWLTPSIARLASQPEALVANPLWCANRFSLATIRAENRAEDEDFFSGYGFSDQLFLARRDDLRKPIYEYKHPMSLRYTLSHIAPIFEQRVDSYMRRTGKQRLTYKHAGYDHPKLNEGASYPSLTLAEKLRWHANRAIVKVYKAVSGEV